METDKHPLEYVSSITELNEIHEFMQDDKVDRAMDYVVKLMMKPDVPAAKAPQLVTELQAMATYFAIQSKFYSVFRKGPEFSKKKNVYYTLAENMNHLVNALKYSAKNGMG